MPRPHPSTWTPLLERALAEEIGISFRVSGIGRQAFRNTLYETMKADPKYKQLITFLPDGECIEEIFICKKEVELGEGA